MPARVDVVIPMFESELTVEQTIRSLQAQTLIDWRAIVVNDGSTDRGPQVVQRLASDDDRITMRSQPNAGLPAARNAGIEAAHAHYLHFLDADDILYPESLEALVGAAEESGLGAAYGGYEFLDEQANPIGRQTGVSGSEIGLDGLLGWNRFIAHSQIISTKKIGATRFDESLRSSEDYDFWLRLAERGVRWAGVDRFVAGYRIRPDSMSKDFALMARNESRVLRGAYQRARNDESCADASIERERQSATGSALAYSTRAALAGAPDDARNIFAECGNLHAVTPEAAATCAIFAIQFGSARSPAIVLEEPSRWLGPLDTWWRGLASSRRTAEANPARFVDAALRALSARMLHPRMIAEAMLDEAPTREGVVIIGDSPRGRWIGRVASERGVEAMLVPEAHETPAALRWDDIGALTRRCPLDTASINAPILLTPGVSGPTLDSSRVNVRWEACAKKLAEEVEDRLARVWP